MTKNVFRAVVIGFLATAAMGSLMIATTTAAQACINWAGGVDDAFFEP